MFKLKKTKYEFKNLLFVSIILTLRRIGPILYLQCPCRQKTYSPNMFSCSLNSMLPRAGFRFLLVWVTVKGWMFCCIASNVYVWWWENSELKLMWKEVIMPSFEVLSLHLSEGNKENHIKPQPDRDFNPIPPKYEAAVLPNEPRRSVHLHVNKILGFFKT
jgi:hypothetical protein